MITNGFVGYYDFDPIYKDNLIYFDHEHCEIRSKNLTTGRDLFIAKSNAFNWQQGPRLQVTGGKIFYTDIVNNLLVTKMVDVNSLDVRVFEQGGLGFAHLGHMIFLNYSRIEETGIGYGFSTTYRENMKYNELLRHEYNDKFEYVLTEEDLIQNGFKGKFEINHPLVHGGYVYCILRIYSKNGSRESVFLRLSRKGIHVFDHTLGIVSHFCIFKEKLLYFGSANGNIGWHWLDLNSGVLSDAHALKKLGDGHPAVIGDKIIIDSYPNLVRKQMLYEFDPKLNNLSVIGFFKSSYKFNGNQRCDLHPKTSENGRFYVDVTMNGSREIVELRND